MDVFLVPIGSERYDLYCEDVDEPQESEAEEAVGVVRRLKHRFSVMLAEAERDRRHGRTAHPEGGWLAGLKTRTMRWVAESIAEQRLLWHLRRQSAACLFHPDDLDSAAARDVLRRQLARDFDRHRFWLTLDSVALVASALLIILPGPNVVGFYFAFRVVGHYLSVRGARHGLDSVEWRHEPSAPLTQLRRALTLDGEMREALVHEVALQLRLEHFERFFNRAAIRD